MHCVDARLAGLDVEASRTLPPSTKWKQEHVVMTTTHTVLTPIIDPREGKDLKRKRKDDPAEESEESPAKRGRPRADDPHIGAKQIGYEVLACEGFVKRALRRT